MKVSPTNLNRDSRTRGRGRWWCLLAPLAILVALVPPAAAQATAVLTFGPADPNINGLPEWVASPGRPPCELTVLPGDDHGAYYALEGVGTQNGIRFKYIAAVEGLDALPGMAAPEVVNLVLLRLEGVVPGRTYTIEEPFGQFTSITPTASRFVEEVLFVDPATGPVTDFLPTGTFRVLDGTTVLISESMTAACALFASGGNEDPVARFTASCVENTCSFDASASTDGDGTIVAYGWDFGDGSPMATGVTATHMYTTGGPKTVTLGVTDDLGGFNQASRTVHINLAPTANFTVTCVRTACSFDGTSSTDPDGTIIAYGWDFGDGSSAFGATVNKTYASGAARTVTLTVVDNGGVTRSLSRVVDTTPIVNATFSTNGGNEWWVTVKVRSPDGTPSAVCAKVDGGACRTLILRSWGSWAASFRVPSGSHVTFMATFPAGTIESGAYVWPSGAPATGGGGGTPPPPPGDFTATFRPYDGNNWWVQSKVSGSEPITAVCASVNGGACTPLTLRSWGAWAKSFFVPTGAEVRFTATGSSGATVTSSAYSWPIR